MNSFENDYAALNAVRIHTANNALVFVANDEQQVLNRAFEIKAPKKLITWFSGCEIVTEAVFNAPETERRVTTIDHFFWSNPPISNEKCFNRGSA